MTGCGWCDCGGPFRKIAGRMIVLALTITWVVAKRLLPTVMRDIHFPCKRITHYAVVIIREGQ